MGKLTPILVHVDGDCSGEEPTVLSTCLEAETGGRTSESFSFRVRSTPMTEAKSEDKAVLHCQGRVLRHTAEGLLAENGELAIRPTMPAAHELRLRDMTRQGGSCGCRRAGAGSERVDRPWC